MGMNNSSARNNLRRIYDDMERMEDVTHDMDKGVHQLLKETEDEESELREELREIEELEEVLNKALHVVDEIEKIEEKFESDIEKAQKLEEDQARELFKEDMQNLLKDLEMISEIINSARTAIKEEKERLGKEEQEIHNMEEIDERLLRALEKIGADVDKKDTRRGGRKGSSGLMQKISQEGKKAGILKQGDNRVS
jgi:chromosome segregation ATPase